LLAYIGLAATRAELPYDIDGVVYKVKRLRIAEPPRHRQPGAALGPCAQFAAEQAQTVMRASDLRLGHDFDRVLGDPRQILRPAKEIADGPEEIAHILLGEGVPKDSIGTRCVTLEKPAAGAAPTRRDGLSARISSGKRASIAALRWRSRS